MGIPGCFLLENYLDLKLPIRNFFEETFPQNNSIPLKCCNTLNDNEVWARRFVG